MKKKITILIAVLSLVLLKHYKIISVDWTQFEQDIKQKAGLPPERRCKSIHDAAIAGDLAQLNQLIANGANINEPGCFWQMTPLQVIFFDEKVSETIAFKVAPWLLDHGAVNALEYKDPDFQRTALHWATLKRYPTMIRLLAQKGAHLDPTDINENTPLHSAATQNDPASVQTLIDLGANINKPQRTSTIALDKDPLPLAIHMAAFAGFNPVLEVFLKYQDINIQDSSGSTPLHYAALQLNSPVIAFLLEKGARKDIKNKAGKSPLGNASSALSARNPNWTPEQLRQDPIVQMLMY